MYLIRKKINLEMAHRLTSAYSKSCTNIHGHSYILEVFCASEILNLDGMVIDFSEIKDSIKEIVDKYDHSLILSSIDPISNQIIEGKNVLKIDTNKLIIVDYNPTAEEMAKDIYNQLRERLGNALHKVRLHETDTGYAEYKPEWKTKNI